VILSLSCSSLPFWFGLPLFVPFLALRFSLVLDDLFKLFLVFYSSSCASWGLGVKL
jgi:hypothetical protein